MNMQDKIGIYESLLNQKASLDKEGFHYSLEYTREFGDEIRTIFELKVEILILKKKIAFCVRKSNRNETIYTAELDRYTDDEILNFQTRLEELTEHVKSAKQKGQVINYEQSKKIKKLYYEIVHLIHPDLHPNYSHDEELKELWNKAVTSYKCNDYKSLVQVYDQIIIKVKNEEAIINNIDEKIESLKDEIKETRESLPYQYKFLLESEEDVDGTHEQYTREISDYQEYKAKLEQDLATFNIFEGSDA